MFRLEARTLLHDDGVMRSYFGDRMYPNEDRDRSELSERHYPAAFDPNTGLILPTLLVQDDGAFPFGPLGATISSTFRLLVWQADGRDKIDAAFARSFTLLDGARFNAGTTWVYACQFAGEGPNLRDQALGDAEYGWQSWQAIALRQ